MVGVTTTCHHYLRIYGIIFSSSNTTSSYSQTIFNSTNVMPAGKTITDPQISSINIWVSNKLVLIVAQSIHSINSQKLNKHSHSLNHHRQWLQKCILCMLFNLSILLIFHICWILIGFMRSLIWSILFVMLIIVVFWSILCSLIDRFCVY